MKLQELQKERSMNETGVKSCTSAGEYRNDGDVVSRAKSCDFDVFLSEENSLYTKNEIRSRESRGEYVPSDTTADAKQIKAVRCTVPKTASGFDFFPFKIDVFFRSCSVFFFSSEKVGSFLLSKNR